MPQLTIDLPDFVSADEARLLLAIRLFQDDRVSCGRAAEIAGISKRDFMLELGKRKIPVFDLSPEEFASQLEVARAADGQQ